MKRFNFLFEIFIIFVVLLVTISCKSQDVKRSDTAIVSKIEGNQDSVIYGEHDKVSTGILDPDGNLWFGTNHEGIYRYNGESFMNFTEEDGLSSNVVHCLAVDKNGDLWIGTQNGLSIYNGKGFSNIPIPWDGKNNIWGKMANPNVVQCMLFDKNDDLWVGTAGGGAYRYDGTTFQNFTFTNDKKQSDGLHHNFIQSMIEDTKGNMWFTSMTHGAISRYDGNEMTYFSSKDGVKDDMMYASYQDQNGILWFGSIQTKFAGLYRYDGSSFTSFGKEDGLCDNFVTGFYEDRNGLLLIRTGSILCQYDGKKFSPFSTKDGKELRDISFICEDKGENIWMGGRYGHLWRYNGETIEDFTQKGR